MGDDFAEEGLDSCPRSYGRAPSATSLGTTPPVTPRALDIQPGGIWVEEKLSARERAIVDREQEKLESRKAKELQHQEPLEKKPENTEMAADATIKSGPSESDDGRGRGATRGGRGCGERGRGGRGRGSRGRGSRGRGGRGSAAVQAVQPEGESTAEAQPASMAEESDKFKTPVKPRPKRIALRKDLSSGPKATETPQASKGECQCSSPGWISQKMRARPGEAGTFANRRRTMANASTFDLIKSHFEPLGLSSRHQVLFWRVFTEGQRAGMTPVDITKKYQDDLKPSPTKKRTRPAGIVPSGEEVAKQGPQGNKAWMQKVRTPGMSVKEAAAEWNASRPTPATAKKAAKSTTKKTTKKTSAKKSAAEGKAEGAEDERPLSQTDEISFQPLSQSQSPIRAFQPLSQSQDDDIPPTQRSPVSIANLAESEHPLGDFILPEADPVPTAKAKGKAAAKSKAKAKGKAKAAPKAKGKAKAAPKAKGKASTTLKAKGSAKA